MIGNDLVDLNAASRESNWKRKGFQNKLFNEKEQAIIISHINPEEMVWLLWSMKEAAYKIYNKVTGIREYAPLKLSCTLTESYNAEYYGKVQISGKVYFTKSTLIQGDYIHTLAAEQESTLNSIRETIYPISLMPDYKTMAAASVSHHGQYLALIT